MGKRDRGMIVDYSFLVMGGAVQETGDLETSKARSQGRVERGAWSAKRGVQRQA